MAINETPTAIAERDKGMLTRQKARKGGTPRVLAA